MNKKRILVVGESHYLKTGYGKINQEICSRLHNSGYTVGEFANYGEINIPTENAQVPKPHWTYYGNMPSNDEENGVYQSNPHNQFGAWRFNDVCLHFRPDWIISYLDAWMSTYCLYSPYRKCFNFLWVPTVDGLSLGEQWLFDYTSCNSILTYTDWAKKVLEEEGGGQIKVRGVAPPGVDNKIFMPVPNKAKHKQMFGLNPNMRIIGTVMRNQKRKLYPDLLRGFSQFLTSCKDKQLAQQTFLYLHLAYPDLGWDIPKLIKEEGLSHKILFTYICKACGAAYVSFWQDSITNCVKCGQISARLPNTQHGVNDETLAAIYNIFDIYIQYAHREGLGMPAIEAAACGVPIITIDYAGPEDFKDKIAAFPISPLCLNRESETHQYNCSPNNEVLAQKLEEVLSLEEKSRRKIGFEARKGALKYYNWDTTAHTLMREIDQLEGNWNLPPKFHQPNMDIPQGISDKEFLMWAYANILGEPERINSYMFINTLRNLNMGYIYTSGGKDEFWITEDSLLSDRQKLQNYDRNKCVEELLSLCNKRNELEQKRIQPFQIPSWMELSLRK